MNCRERILEKKLIFLDYLDRIRAHVASDGIAYSNVDSLNRMLQRVVEILDEETTEGNKYQRKRLKCYSESEPLFFKKHLQSVSGMII